MSFSSMYILLRGQVTVYHNYDNVADGSDDVDATAAVATMTGAHLRQQLGAFVVTLKGESILSPFFVRCIGKSAGFSALCLGTTLYTLNFWYNSFSSRGVATGVYR